MKKYIIYFLVAVSLVSVSGCKDYLDINTNPNQLTVTDPGFILAGAITTTAAIKFGGDFNNFAGQWSGYYAASGSYSQSGDVVRTYVLTQAYSNTIWSDLYLNMSNYQYVENNVGGDPNYAYYVAICEIMKAHNFGTLVDVFGNVPYKQALTGFTYLYPKYDDGAVVYAGIINKLDSAVQLIKAGAANPAIVTPSATVDVMFGGNMAGWAKLANTLKLRLLVHETGVGAAKVSGVDFAGEVAKITANGYGYLDAGQTAYVNPGYQQVGGLQTPLWENYGNNNIGQVGGRDYIRVSAYTVTKFGANDVRLYNDIARKPGDPAGVSTATSAGDIKGIVFGALPSTANNSAATSGWGPGLVSGPLADAPFFTAAESLFIQAEAALKGLTSGDPAALYDAAVLESFDFYGEDGTAYLAANSYASASDKLSQIINEKWKADWGLDAMETWTDLRRTGFPSDVPLSADPTRLATTTSPVRLLYPQSEYNNNPNNAAAQGTINQFTSKIFWDLN